MLTDIEIAQSAKMLPAAQIAAELGIDCEQIEPYGKYIAKLSDELYESLKSRQDGKLVLVTAINPTPAGEGKTTTTVGLGQARAARRAADTPRLSRWRKLTSTLPAICTLLPQRIISSALSSTTISSRGTNWELTKGGSCSNAAWI